MRIYDFVSQEEIEDLPEDSQAAFIQLINHAHRRFNEKEKNLTINDEDDWDKWHDICLSFMSIVIAAAKKYNIEPLAGLRVPTVKQFDSRDFRQFRADLDFFTSQMVLDNSLRSRHDTVFIEEKDKHRIKSHLHHLRECVLKSNLSAGKRTALIRKIEELEQELNKQRLSILKVMGVTLGVMAQAGGVWQSAEIVHGLVTNVLEMVGQAKDVEDETRQLPPVQPPAALAPPRHAEESEVRPNHNDLDDEIPF